MRIDGSWNIVIILAALGAGLTRAIKPEKAQWNGNATKASVTVARVAGIVILALLAIAAVFFLIAWKTGQRAL